MSRSPIPRQQERAVGGGPVNPARLGPAERAAGLDRLGREVFDVVVIGGGVVGCGAALDAVTRGLSVALVEAADIAWGTSSRSSKLFHGGLRYLEMLEFGLVREALRERELMLTRICPHLAKPVSFLYPLTRHIERPYVGCGLVLYDAMSGARSMPRHRHLTRSGALRVAPALRRSGLVGAIRFFDGQVDDARHTLTVARTAAVYGAVVCTSTQAVGFVKERGRVTGVRVRDAETGEEITVRCRTVITSTGVWTDDMQRLSGGRRRLAVRASKGVHVLVSREKIPSQSGIILRTEKSVLFVMPWKSHWIIGTTDTEWRHGLDHPAVTEADIGYLLDRVNRVLATPLRRDDIEGVYAGLRPLLGDDGRDTTRLSRGHAVVRQAPGLVAVAGGKYTTYRLMAAEAVDAVAVDLPSSRIRPSCTAEVPLLGADGYRALVNQVDRLAQRFGLPAGRVQSLLDRYGSMIGEVLAPAAEDRGLLDPLPGAEDYLQVEALYATTHEGALHVEDVLARRTRIAIEYPHRGTETAPRVAELMAGVLGWSDLERDQELEAYLARVDAERQSQAAPDDASAERAHREAPRIRGLAASPAA